MLAAFSLRDDEDTLSVLWLEYFSGTTKEEIIGHIRQDLLRARQPKKGDVLGIVGIGEARDKVSSELHIELQFMHTPGRSQSHTSIIGMKCDREMAIAQILADIASREFYPAIIPPPPQEVGI
jgi:hypothetical protein